ncbi:hypothetical protein JXA02_09915, partial [candidate division KSB1 bacterium]
MRRYTVTLAFLLVLAAFAQAADISATLDVDPISSATGENTIHQITWTTITPLDIRAQFVIYYNRAFSLDQLLMATSWDPITMDGRLNIDRIDKTSDPSWYKIYLTRSDRNFDVTAGVKVGINLGLVGNPAPGAYSFRLETYAAGVNPDTTPPEDSGTATITITPPITNFQLTSAVETVKVGVPFQLSVSNAITAEGDPADGLVIVSFETGTLQDHAAPDGTLPDLVAIPVKNGSGSAYQTVYRDENIIKFKGVVDGGSFSRLLPNYLGVDPGDLGSFSMTGYPSSVIAGEAFASPVRVKAYDKWQNPKVDYTGSIYFASTDPQAVFTRNSLNPFIFTGSESGQYDFSGSNFQLRTAGVHTFSVRNTQQTVSEESSNIQVAAAPIASFAFDAVGNQTAGQAFELRVINARDSYNNPASGTIVISLLPIGDHRSPNGQQPILNNIVVANGSGAAYQSLFKSELANFRGQLLTNSTITSISQQFTIGPADLGALVMSGYPQSTQTGAEFTQAVKVTAKDIYGNDKTNFNGTVSFSTTDTNPDRKLPAPFQFPNYASHDFPGSDFKLVSLGQQTISVTSGGVTGTTTPIMVIGPNRIEIRRIVADAATVSRGQTQIPVSMEVYNAATLPFENYTAELTFRSGADDKTSDYFVPVANGTIAAQGQRAIAFLVNVNANATLGEITLDGKINGYYNGTELAQAPNANITDAWEVQRPAAVQIRSAEVIADTIPKGSSNNALRLSLGNNGGLANSAAASIQNISFTFKDQTGANVSSFFPVTASPQNPNSIAGDDTTDFNFGFAAAANAPSGVISISARVDYQDVNLKTNQSTSSLDFDTFRTVSTASIRIVSIKSEKLTVTRGQPQSFPVRMRLQNTGESELEIDFDAVKTFIKIEKGLDKIPAEDIIMQLTLMSGSRKIGAGKEDTLEFRVNRIRDTIPAGDYTIFGRVESINGISSTSELSNAYGSVRVQDPDNVIIHQVKPTVATATVNDDTRPWQVKVALRNAGGSDVMIEYATSTLVGLASKGFIVESPYMKNGDAILSGGELDTLIFPITKTGAPRGAVTIDPRIQFRVINTNELKTKQASETGVQSSVLLQDPAELAIRRVRSSVSAVSVGQTPAGWTVAVHVENSGEAELAIDFASLIQTVISFRKDGTVYDTFSIQRPDRLAGSGGAILAGGQQDSLVFRITSHTAEVGVYDIHASVRAIETNRDTPFFAQTNATTIGTVRVVDAAAIAYQAGTLEPTTVAPNRAVRFQLWVLNSGGADVVLEPDASIFTLNAGAQTFTARLDGATTIPGNSQLLLQFEERFLAAAFPLGDYVPTVRLVGVENGQPFDRLLDLAGETVTVGDAGGITISELRPSVATVTQGQTKAWTIDVVVTNNSPQTLKLKEKSIDFHAAGGSVASKFQVTMPDTFANGSPFLAAGATSAVPFRVTSVAGDAPVGDILISSSITMSDEGDTGVLYPPVTKFGGPVTVQTKAVLQIVSFRPSQFSVTRGQTEPWTVGVRVRNSGGSAVKIDPGSMVLDLVSFDNGLFTVEPSLFVGANSDTLLGGNEDSLFFQVTRVSESLPLTTLGGDSLGLVGEIGLREINTDRLLPLTSNEIGIAIQDPARVRIERFEAMIASGGSVDAGGAFYLRALVRNSGAFDSDENNDDIKKATVKMIRNSAEFTFESGIDTASVVDLEPGESAWTAPIKVLTPMTAGRTGLFSAEIGAGKAIARNTNGPAIIEAPGPQYSSIRVTTQDSARLSLEVVPERTTIPSGSSRPWSIYAVVSNTGEGVVELAETSVDDVQIIDAQGKSLLPGTFSLEAVSLGPDRQLRANEVDTLQYLVNQTWLGTGDYQIRVALQATPLNDTTRTVQLVDSTVVTLTNTAVVSIRTTEVDTAGTTVDAGVAHVNAGQSFVVSTTVRNESSGFFTLVKVVLETEASKVELPDTLEITDLDKDQSRELRFTVVADSVENLVGEMMHARIVQAITSDGPVSPGPAADSSVVVKIYRPAKLNIVAVENLAPNPRQEVSLSQEFPIRVKVKNEGSEGVRNIQLRLTPDSGLVTIPKFLSALPNELVGGEVDSVDFVVKVGVDTGLVTFTASVENARGVNSRQMPDVAPAADDTSSARLVNGAHLVIDRVLPDNDVIEADRRDWLLRVAVKSSGQADLRLDGIADTNLTFSKDGVIDDYKVVAPSALENAGNFELKANATDTLVYRIRENGELAGLINIHVLLNGVDLNTVNMSTPLVSTAEGDTAIEVTADAYVRIFKTTALTNQMDRDGNGLVNRGQPFEVSVQLETGDIGGVDSVIVKLTTNGLSFSNTLFDTIATIDKKSQQSVNFSVTADDDWSSAEGEIREVFTAEIIRALVKGDSIPAKIRLTDTNVAKVRIQEPARLSYRLQLGQLGGSFVQLDTSFIVIAKMKNLGRAPIGEGQIAVTPPKNYRIKIGQD